MATIVLRTNERKYRATMLTAISLDGTSPALRVSGTLTVHGKLVNERLDVLITDSQGTVIGLARTMPAQEGGGNQATDFFGYARNAERNASTPRLVIMFADKSWCVVRVS